MTMIDLYKVRDICLKGHPLNDWSGWVHCGGCPYYRNQMHDEDDNECLVADALHAYFPSTWKLEELERVTK